MKKILAIVGVLMVLPFVAMADLHFEGGIEYSIYSFIFGLFVYPWCIIFGVGAIKSKKPVPIRFIVTLFMICVQLFLLSRVFQYDVPITRIPLAVICMFLPLCFAIGAGIYNIRRTS